MCVYECVHTCVCAVFVSVCVRVCPTGALGINFKKKTKKNPLRVVGAGRVGYQLCADASDQRPREEAKGNLRPGLATALS